jgi:polyisoprenoid-binding protein YceI
MKLYPNFNPSARKFFVSLVCAGGLLLAGCAPAAAPPTSTPEPTSPRPTEPAPTTEAVELLTLALVPDKSEIRYLVQEQFADQDLPSKAIGVTNAITGQIVIGTDGIVVPEESLFTVDLTTLKTDQRERDKWVEAYYLQTARFPVAEFRVTEVVGLPVPLPDSGQVAFQLTGDMNIHGVTQAITWDVAAEIQGEALVGRAETSFEFGAFNVTVPHTKFLLSVEDKVELELDFHLVLEDL